MKTYTVHHPKSAAQGRPGAPRPAAPRATGAQLDRAAAQTAKDAAKPTQKDDPAKDEKPKEIGGPSGPEPTRYGDWERKGICYDF